MPALLIPQAFTLCTYLKNKVIAKVTEDLLCSISVSEVKPRKNCQLIIGRLKKKKKMTDEKF